MKFATNNKIQGRVFVVGCPRSGTTLLQSLIAVHPEIATFPESHFFKYLIPSRPWLRKLGIASRWAKPRFKQFLNEIDSNEFAKFIPKITLFTDHYAQAFVEVLDILTIQQNKSIWLEKTPVHLHYIECIEKNIPNAKFIHIIRNGLDVVASLYDVTHKYPHQWGKVMPQSLRTQAKPWDIDRCINQWTQDIKISLRHLSKPNHTLVRYEQLVDKPQSTLQEINQFIGIEFELNSPIKNRDKTDYIALEKEPWKTSFHKSINNKNNQKIYTLFDDQQIKYILNNISVINLENINCTVN